MIMKVFNKGQVVIPASIRRGLGVGPGDMLDVSLDQNGEFLIMQPHSAGKAKKLAGSLSRFRKGRNIPDKKQISQILRKGLILGS
jgi:AbrB family looped-hinge helix DNA binding protein